MFEKSAGGKAAVVQVTTSANPSLTVDSPFKQPVSKRISHSHKIFEFATPVGSCPQCVSSMIIKGIAVNAAKNTAGLSCNVHLRETPSDFFQPNIIRTWHLQQSGFRV
jgi:hypothetical protein